MQYATLIGLLLPLLGFLILMITASLISRKLVSLIGVGTIFVSFLIFATLTYQYITSNLEPQKFTFFNWIPVQGINADFSLKIDPLSLVMTLVITGVGFLIHLYSIGYMEHDEDYARYFSCMNLFVFSMLLLVLASHLLLLFVGWEGVGLVSYLLIGYYYTHPAAAQAATKAFVINRIGDFGFLVALLFTFYIFGTGDIETVNNQASSKFAIGAPIVTLITLLYFMGATGKSAQLPLYTWLPDAMEGPTPVSALIHAATMVTAGVYLVVRLHPLFEMSPFTMHLIAGIGGATAIYAAICAVGQTDLKRVLAYSTVSQLGFMFLACGVGAYYAAMFHLVNHAFIKSLLFLSAGNVVHMMHGTTDMQKMGGLGKIFTKTHWLFLIGVLCLSGIPPLSAFFSKDLILEQDYQAGFKTLFYVGLTASILTAFYLTRAYCLTFDGVEHLNQKVLKAVKEAPSIMIWPVSILAVLALFSGLLGFTWHKMPLLEGFLSQVGVTLYKEETGGMIAFLMAPETWMSIIGAFAGLGLSFYLYTRHQDHVISLFKNSFYVNEIYWALFAVPLRAVANFIANISEPKIIDGAVWLLERVTQGIARGLQVVQSGQIRSYIALMAVGAVLIIFYLVY